MMDVVGATRRLLPILFVMLKVHVTVPPAVAGLGLAATWKS